ncbi:MAG: glycine betaine ABC transporter substrate-binding protein [Planctomycetota bacterium]
MPAWVVPAIAMLLFCAASVAFGQEVSPVPEPSGDGQTVRVGGKNFTEQEILGELIAQLLELHTDLQVERRLVLGGTDICHSALVSGELDIYVEYTGTALLNVLQQEVINEPDLAWQVVARAYIDQFDLEWLPPIGFNNTYAMAVRSADAEANEWVTIGDLAGDAADLSGGFPPEFIERPDGLPGLVDVYGLDLGRVIDLDPGLMYQAVAEDQVDIISAFATDGRIEAFDLFVLEDDKRFFPPYDAAPIVRRDLLEAHPEVRFALASVAGTISDDEMRQMNYAVDVAGRTPAEVAREWIATRIGLTADAEDEAIAEMMAEVEAAAERAETGERSGIFSLFRERFSEVMLKTRQHLVLTAWGTGLAILIGIPLGVFIHRTAPARGPVLAMTEVVQTIPSLAMLAFLFAIWGLLGAAPAVSALVLYALLPIVLNTFTGLRGVEPQIIEAADGIGMSNRQRLFMVELPLAAPVIIAGIRAATVLTVGIATLSTYIGAGGLGDFIARGLARNDPRLTMLGAIPAAIMAVVLSLLIRFAESRFKRNA